ncbi:MAG: amidase [Rhodospirillaceae bacterium]|nr:amidase [Rhodospirillaceae bacterium]
MGLRASLGILLLAGALTAPAGAADSFRIEETTIEGIQGAIQSGAATCRDVVKAYIARAKAYNGICTNLVTPDGKAVRTGAGAVRAGTPLKFPAQTKAASSYLPDLDQYEGPPLDFGRMENTASDPGVQQQYGMVVGRKDAGAVNALETLNIRGERSVACKAACDTAPSKGANPAHCPAQCDAFRNYPDALERAAELDAQYGRKPDLAKLPLYCTVVTVKDWYDVKDMRSTGGNDVAYAMDAAPRDSTVVRQVREKGAIVFGVSIAAEVTHLASGPETPKRTFLGGGGSIRSSWAGHVCNPYDTERSAGPSSGGAGASVAANLATCSICETTSGSCREPAGQNAAVSFVTTKGLTSEDGTATAQHINHRPGAICRTLGDAARVVDAMKEEDGRSYDPRDMFTALPAALKPSASYASFTSPNGAKPLAGMRIGIVREYMVKHAANDGAITDLIDAEVKAVLQGKLGAQIVESVDPKWPDDTGVPNMTYTFQDALAEVLPVNVPEYFHQMDGDTPEFAVPGYDVRTRDYLVALSLRKAPLSPKLNLRRLTANLDNTERDAFMMARYLAERGDAKIKTWADYAANSKWRAEDIAAGSRNAATRNPQDLRATQGIDRMKMQTVIRMIVTKVMRENKLDVLVHPNMGVPQWKIGTDREPVIDGRAAAGPWLTDTMGGPEIAVPAGYNQIVYDARYVLSADKKSYSLVTGTEKGLLNHPMPVSLLFWAGPGEEAAVLKAAGAYEAASRHRAPPPQFGPLR